MIPCVFSITGGAGCLGSNLIEHWLPQGHEILVIDNFATGKREVLPPVAGLSVIEGSVTDAGLLERAFDSFRRRMSCTARPRTRIPTTGPRTPRPMQGSINVAKAASKAGVKRLLNFQTALCYGRPATVPIPIDSPTAPLPATAFPRRRVKRS